MIAGNASLSLLLSYTFARFCKDPEFYQTLRRDPSLIPGAIEEILRFDGSTHLTGVVLSPDCVP